MSQDARIRAKAVVDEEERRFNDVAQQNTADEVREISDRAVTSELVRKMNDNGGLPEVIAVLNNFYGQYTQLQYMSPMHALLLTFFAITDTSLFIYIFQSTSVLRAKQFAT